MKGTRLLLRKARLGETPQAHAEEAPRPPLDKRVPEAEINIQIVQAIIKAEAFCLSFFVSVYPSLDTLVRVLQFIRYFMVFFHFG
ncbi:hypothetical protein SRABI80_00076 [Peribacillus frigoritolerans]|nr:hypothetical protein SRABI80_00076 [Peribacillus frigoritolerans]